MRVLHKRKRSNGMPLRAFKRRRRVVRRGRRSRAGFATTSRALSANTAFKPKARKLRKSTWRKYLWRDTLQMAHYRTIRSQQQTIVTPNDVVGMNYSLITALDQTTGSEFWKSAGGAMDPSFGQTPQFMNANGAGPPVGFDPVGLVLRGGRLWMTVACQDGDSCTARIQLIFLKQQFRDTNDAGGSNTFQTWFTAITAFGARPKSWDIQTAPDYETFMYKPVIDKTVQLQQGQTVTVYFKVKPTKIDVEPFKVGGGWYPVWLVYYGQDMNVVTGAATAQLSYGHNMSFSVTDLPQ